MKRLAGLIIVSGLAAAAQAQEFTLGGYGTVGFAHSDNRQAD